MKYTIMRYNRHFLEIVKKNVTEEELSEYGEMTDKMYANYDENQLCGFIYIKNKDKYYIFMEK